MALEGHDVKNHDVFSVFLISEKLDAESRRQWELDSASVDPQMFEQLMEFIDKRARALEASPSIPPRTEQPPRQDFKTPDRRFQSYHMAEQECPTCEAKEHVRLFKCSKFQVLGANERMDEVTKLRLCYNCLQPGHMTRDCNSKSKCRECQRPHQMMLHAASSAPALEQMTAV